MGTVPVSEVDRKTNLCRLLPLEEHIITKCQTIHFTANKLSCMQHNKTSKASCNLFMKLKSKYSLWTVKRSRSKPHKHMRSLILALEVL